MKKILVVFFIFLMLTLSVNAKINSISEYSHSKKNDRLDVNIFNKGWMEEIDGVKVLHLNGSFYEMGYQLGSFLKYEILRNLRAFGLSDLKLKNETCRLWSIQKNYVSDELVDYIQGTADAAGVSFDDVGCIWVWEKNCSLSCSGYMAEGSATSSNEIIHVYSLDFPVSPVDPVTGFSVLNDPVMIVGKPDSGNAFMYPSFAGYVVESGMNAEGIVISNTASPCKDENDYGSPVGIRLLEALYKTSNIDDTVDILNQNRTYGYDYLISDVNTNSVYVLEQTANITYLGRWNDSCESKHPFFQLDHIIRRTNCFINPETAATQRDYYNLKDIRYLLKFKFGNFYEWCRYKAISMGCQKYLGDLDLNNALSLFRDVYLGKNGGLSWYIVRHMFMDMWGPWYQWSYSPKTGDMLICYADPVNWASENPVHHFNFYELLEEEPNCLND